MRFFFYIVLFLVFLDFGYGQDSDLKIEIERIILHDTEINMDDVPGFIIGIVDHDTVYVIDFGTAEKGIKKGLTMNDVFETGSITKVMTASLTSILQEKGLIRLDEPINKYIPGDYTNPRMDKVRIIDLIRHTSGLPVRPYFFGIKEKDPQNPYAAYTKKDLLTFYRDFVPVNVGEYNYAHTNYGLLEIILEQATGISFDKLAEDYFFSPLGLKDSFVFFKERKKNVLTPGYDRAGRLTSPWAFASFGASEGLKTTLKDMIRFLMIQMGVIPHPLGEVLSGNTIPEVTTNFNESLMAAKGWQVIRRKRKYDIITHTGKTSGHSAFVAFVPETKTGVVILANSSLGTRDLGFLILRMINYNWKRKRDNG